MALSGVHIACGYAGTKGVNGSALPLLNRIVWSQTMSSGGTTTQGAPAGTSDQDGSAIFEIRATLDIFVAVGGSAPNAAGDARVFVPANETYHIGAKDTGDKLAWIAA